MVKFIRSLKILPRWIILLLDLSILLSSVAIAYLLRFNFDLEDIYAANFSYGLILYSATGLFSIFLTRSYSGIIRYTGLQDGLRILYSTSLGFGLTIVLNFINQYWVGKSLIPLSVLIIAYLNSMIFLFTYRLFVKYLFSYYSKTLYRKVNAIIYGTGQAAMITNEIVERDPKSSIRVVAFAEDDENKIGKEIHGIKIYSAERHLELLIKRFNLKEFIISVDDISLKRKNELVDLCLTHGIKVRSTPPVGKWVKGELSWNQIKDINIEELLGRESIKLDNYKVRSEIKDKCILITGAAGSIGSELTRQVLLNKPRFVVLVDQSETSLHEFEKEVGQNGSSGRIQTVIADICNYQRIESIFKQYQPDIVFHAAAYKHVPMMEINPAEAVLCNIQGTKNLADISVNHQVESFVMISTDKAVNPTSVMGASKRIAEIYVQSLNNFTKEKNLGNTCFITTRFGNVLGSNGSVIPLFKKQIEEGGPITVTHPEITRYFMTISEACQLVLEAGAMGFGGEVYIFDMGKSIRIVDLAKKMIQLSGLQLGTDIEIQFVGIRNGEKLHEELLNNMEDTIPTHHSKIMIAKIKQENFDTVSTLVNKIIETAANSTEEMELVRLMKGMVPEFKSNYSRFEALDQKIVTAN